MNFNGHCFNNISIPKKIRTVYISDTLGSQLKSLYTYFILDDCLFGSVKRTKTADL